MGNVPKTITVMRIVGSEGHRSMHPIGSELWLDESYAKYVDGCYGKVLLSRVEYEIFYKRIKNAKL